MSDRTAVYRFYDADDQLLYVGVTSDLFVRWRYHQANSPWWDKHVRIEVVWRDSRREAEAEETAAVRTEGAIHNVQKRGKTPLKSLRICEELWTEFGDAASAMGKTRSELFREFLSWWLRRPGAKLPQRPAATGEQEAATDE